MKILFHPLNQRGICTILVERNIVIGTKTQPEHHEKSRIAWHPAFYDAIRLELLSYKDVLRFEFEHPLNREPLKIDVIVVKKEKGAVLDKPIAAIFRDVNIIEFKSPEDSLGIADFHKVTAYARLYCTTMQDVDLTDMSVSFITRRRPEKLLGYLEGNCKYAVEEPWPGIYQIRGDIQPVQIIESRKLPEEDNLWLKNLSRGISAASMSRILEQSSALIPQTPIGAYLAVVLQANPEIMMEVLKMGSGTMTIEEVLEETGWAAKFEVRGEARGEVRGEARGEAKGKREVAKNLIKNGFAPEQVVKLSGLDAETVKELYQTPVQPGSVVS
ncbi:MAG: hypothetical protein LBI90_06085 [Treponema sp.]|nr:hypothetical protein [Treponema sp.]